MLEFVTIMNDFPWLVADIGGTNARFGLVTGISDEGTFAIERIEKFKGADFSTFEDVVSRFLSNHGDMKVNTACVAIAGPVVGDRVQMTNLPWGFSQKALKTTFGLSHFVAINDYTALAMSTASLNEKDLESVIAKPKALGGNKAILGPGTGLGVAGLSRFKDSWVAIPSQGGHVNLPISDTYELELMTALMAQHNYVSAETCLSGMGLVHLYRAVCSVDGKDAAAYEPANISELALHGEDSACKKTLEFFCSMLGSVAANAALTYGATGGVYITGGIIPRFVDFLKASKFAERFVAKGPMSEYVEQIPVDVVVHDTPALIGAAECLKNL